MLTPFYHRKHSRLCSSLCLSLSQLVGPLSARQSYDGRFANAFLRCYGEDVSAAMNCWRSELKTKTSGGVTGTAQALAGLCYCAGRSARPDVALKVSYAATKGQKGKRGSPDEAFAQVREGVARSEATMLYETTPNAKSSLLLHSSQAYFNGKKARTSPQLSIAMKVFENLLEVESKSFCVDDKRAKGDKKIRIIWK